VAFVDKLSENPVLTQKIAENINNHLMKQQHETLSRSQDGPFGISHTVSSSLSVGCVSSSTVSATLEMVTASSAATTSVSVFSSCNKSTTSTVDLSISEDSLVSALEVIDTLLSDSIYRVGQKMWRSTFVHIFASY